MPAARTTTRGSESSIWKPSSAAVSRVFSGIRIAPSCAAAK